jgi:hypothetical protein
MMSNAKGIIRPYIAESAILPGTAVVQGSADNKVKAPNPSGGGFFIGFYPFEANEAKAAGDAIGIQLTGIAKVRAGGDVTAGHSAYVKGPMGDLVNFQTDDPGNYDMVGMFLEGGAAGEYVDLLIERGSVTIPV